jgi:di/tricarboxylate transporter
MGVPIAGIIPLLIAGVAAYFLPGLGWAPFVIVLTVALMAIGLWPEYVTALIFFTLAMLLHVGKAEMVFAGFCSSAFWLILSGFFMGQAVTRTGFGERVASYVARAVKPGYAWSIAGTAMMAVGMSFLMPSAMGRVLLMLPIIKELAVKLGYKEGERGYTGVTLVGLLCTFVPAMSILPANIPNLVLIGAAEAVGLPRPDYAHYLLLHFPALGFLKTVLIATVIGWMFRPNKEEEAAALSRRAANAGHSRVLPWSGDEIRLAIVLFGCLAMWCTDSMHGISPAWVGMVGAILCLMPGFGMLDSQQAIRELNMGSLLYVSAIISIGVVVSGTGLGTRVADMLLSILPLSPSTPYTDFTVLGLLSTLMAPLTTQPGVPAVLTPMTMHLAAATGFSPFTVMMTQVLGFSTLLFPFTTGPMLVGLHMLKFPIMKATKILFILAGLSIVLLWPVEYFTWWLCGIL